ncbi:MAG: efflux RND transporter periplasmic adaptor subunit [Thermodesulfobacteriota bacterium]
MAKVAVELRPARGARARRAARRALLAAALALVATACSSPQALETAPTARVERRRIERIVVATGTIEPENEVEVRSRISGIVERIHVEAGDRVERSRPLIELERELLAAQAAEARARLSGSKAELARAASELRRAVKLKHGGTMSASEEEDAITRQQSAQAAAARDQAVLDTLEIQLGYATVVAPMDGTILDVDVEIGTAVASVVSVTGGTRLLTIADDRKLHLEGLVDENDVAWVEVGQPARVRTEAFPGRTFAAEVRKIKPLGERQQNVTYFEVEVLITDPDAAKLRPRMSADADIVSEVVEDALVVPETALLYDRERIYVERRVTGDEARFEEATIRVGVLEAGRAQVLEGVAAGDEVRLK